MSLPASFQKFFQQQNSTAAYWIAFSGGMDSHVLLHLLAQLRQMMPLQLRAIHINHSLSPHADSWSEHCARICKQHDIALTQIKVNAQPASGASPENAARIARYAAITPFIAANDILLTAHHQDDQAETLLLQLCRGAGPKGLAAMPLIKKFGTGQLARPLLNFSRQQLLDYACQHHLSWIEDESNANKHFSRNFIRHEVLPVLQQRWPQITATLARSASVCGEAQQLLDEMAAHDLAAVAGSRAQTLSVSSLLALSPKRQRQILRFWLRDLGFTVPSVIRLKQIQQDMLAARADRQPLMAWPGVELRRFRNNLYALAPLPTHDPRQVYPWQWVDSLPLSGVGELRAQAVTGNGIAANLQNVTVRFRQGGEICRLPARDCTHELKKLFQAWQIPVWERERIPLIYAGEQLVAAVGYFIDPEYSAKKDEVGYLLKLSPEQHQ